VFLSILDVAWPKGRAPTCRGCWRGGSRLGRWEVRFPMCRVGDGCRVRIARCGRRGVQGSSGKPVRSWRLRLLGKTDRPVWFMRFGVWVGPDDVGVCAALRRGVDRSFIGAEASRCGTRAQGGSPRCGHREVWLSSRLRRTRASVPRGSRCFGTWMRDRAAGKRQEGNRPW
jgi:hypothetical protein